MGSFVGKACDRFDVKGREVRRPSLDELDIHAGGKEASSN